MNGVDAAAQMPASRRAIRQINFSDSITQGPRMNAGAVPPMTTEPICSGFVFALIRLASVPLSAANDFAKDASGRW